ncbi:histidine kinase [Pelosinus baikalensis]|uniref:histidine kinase n=1 Tax=Pelosinus baikalensis TaxID=2892015 RepID=A0ABS8HQ24_9FIRM|nr:histidine kinase [Pelosinus baikalensis]
MQVVTFSRKMDVLEMIDNKPKKQATVYKNSQVDAIAANAITLVNEISDPLTVIKGYLQVFEKNTVNNQQEWLPLVFQELNRVELLINHFITISQNKKPRS